MNDIDDDDDDCDCADDENNNNNNNNDQQEEEENNNDNKQEQQKQKEETNSSSSNSGDANKSSNKKKKQTSSIRKEKKKKYLANGSIDLFEYTEDELLHENILTYYEILNVTEYDSTDKIKKAYRRASLRYHPDKTGRGDDDYVFLAVKAAYDTLADSNKRSAYDSTVIPFDDTIPSSREKMLNDPILQYKDDDFYTTFQPVFQRNLRFDVRLRPEMATSGGSSSSNANTQQSSSSSSSSSPPDLGDENTDISDVNRFYEYWIHFTSWRDFTSQAADELQIDSNELENAESRFEKRYLQKEIDKRAKQLKREENNRIQTLVERSMDADPRLRAERKRIVDEKERIKKERQDAKIRQHNEQIEKEKQRQIQEEQDKQRRAIEKIEREKEKKLLRKARQALRKLTTASYQQLQNEKNAIKDLLLWDDMYDMNQDVEYLCTNLSLEQLRSITSKYETILLPNRDVVHHDDNNIGIGRGKVKVSQEENNNNKDENDNTATATHAEPEAALQQPQQPELAHQALSMIKRQTSRFKRTRALNFDHDNDDHDIDELDNNKNKNEETDIERNGEAVNLQQQSNQGTKNKNGTTSSTITPAAVTTDSCPSTPKTPPWTSQELSALAKAVKKYPPGGSSRWEQIALFVNNLCKQHHRRSKEECIEKYNNVAKQQQQSSQQQSLQKNKKNQPPPTPKNQNNNNSNKKQQQQQQNRQQQQQQPQPQPKPVENKTTANNTSASSGKGSSSQPTTNAAGRTSLSSSADGNKIITEMTTTTNQNNTSDNNGQVASTSASGSSTVAGSERKDGAHDGVNNNSNAVNCSGWTTKQDQQLQDALSKYPASMDKNERWTSIAKSVDGKNKKECVQRFKAIRDAIINNKKK